MTRVVGLGQPAAGDDGVGLAVLDELARRPIPNGSRLIPLADPFDLVSLLMSPEPLVLVDALLATPAGQVLELEPESLSSRAAQTSSSHGLGAVQSIELARVLAPETAAPVRIVAVTIERPGAPRVGLSPAVAAAVPLAADHVLRLLEA